MTVNEKELQKLKEDIIDDVESLVEKYMEIVAWDVPEYDEKDAKKRLLTIIKESINNIEDKEDKN